MTIFLFITLLLRRDAASEWGRNIFLEMSLLKPKVAAEYLQQLENKMPDLRYYL